MFIFITGSFFIRKKEIIIHNNYSKNTLYILWIYYYVCNFLIFSNPFEELGRLLSNRN